MEKVLLQTEVQIDDSSAVADISLNPSFSWAKILVCDDQPNANKMIVPEDEFENLIRTGVNSPIKMDFGKITDHESSMRKVIGVTSKLSKDGNKLYALAALWNTERKEDIQLLKSMYSEGKLPQVSWEISFDPTKSEKNEDGNLVLRGTSLTGLAIVADPAYTGRTPIVALAERDKGEKMEEELKEKIASLESELETSKQTLASLKEENETLKASVASIEELSKELEELKSFKAEIEKEANELEKISQIKTKFEEAGIKKEETYFEENREKLLAMPESTLEFVLQEMVAFATASVQNTTKLPNFSGGATKLNPKELGKALRELKARKEE